MQNLAEKLGLGDSVGATILWIGLSIVLLVVVLAVAVWLVRMLRPSLNLGGAQSRGGRPQRLAITDAFSMDREGRKLVLVRRDNIEHLLLIGGPNDVLVESNIVRGERGARERGRAMNDPELLQAAEAALAAELPRGDATPEPLHSLPPAPPPPSAPPRQAPPPASPVSKPQAGSQLDDEFENALAAMQAAQRQQAAGRAPAPLMPAPQSSPPPAARPQEPFFQPPRLQPMPEVPAPTVVLPPLPPAPPISPEPVSPPPRQQPMSEMARRLNEVLQKPMSGTLRPPFNKSIPPVPPMAAPKPAAPPEPPAPLPELLVPEPPPAPELPPAAKSDQKPAAEKPAPKASDLEMDLLEEEMARLLGRPQTPGSGTP